MMLLSFCGDRCDLCPRFTASSDSELERVAKLWHKAGWRETVLSADEMRCNGCNIDKECGYGITGCLREKKLLKCSDCENFPCDILKKMLEKSHKSQENCRKKCTAEEYNLLSQAFFFKEKNLGL